MLQNSGSFQTISGMSPSSGMKPTGAPVASSPRTEPRKAMGMVRRMMPARRMELNCQTRRTTIRKAAKCKLAKWFACASSAFPSSPRYRPVVARASCLALLLFLAWDSQAQEPSRSAPTGAEQAQLALGIDYTVALQPWKGDYDGMLERRMVRILVPYSRTHFFLDGARERGLLAAAGRQFEREINRKEGLRTKLVHVMFIPVARSQLIPWLIDGRGDIAAGALAVTEAHKVLVDFSEPFFRNVSDIVVTGPAATPLSALEDLAGQEVFVQPRSATAESLDRLNEAFAAKGLAPIKVESLDELLEPDEILELVQAGTISTTVLDQHMAHFWAQILTDLTVHANLAVAAGRDIAWAFRKNSPMLRDVLDEFIRTHRHRTEFGNIIFRRYLQDTTRIHNAATTNDRARYERAMPLFRKFGEQYDLDPLFLAALGYQESRLDQDARSQVGAIGVMQVMPRTGELLNVGDITQLEPNIHAGTRYFRHLVDGIAGDDVDWLNKTLLALASYNGGQTRIRRLRREAAEQGLDPNVWFHNVELTVAREIGRETVRFVRNVYRYYLVFRLIQKRRAGREATAAD